MCLYKKTKTISKGDATGSGAAGDINVSRFLQELTIFAENSWDDIDLSTFININIDPGSKMICGEDNDKASCFINNNPSNIYEWNCIDVYSPCYRDIDKYHVINCEDRNCMNETIIDCYSDIIENDLNISQFDGCKIKCNEPFSCSNSVIKCLDDKACIIECNSDNSCNIDPTINLGATINKTIIECPINHNCDVECNGYQSCANSLILCPDSQHQCNINANVQFSAIDTHILSGNNSFMNIECKSKASCSRMTINCESASKLNIQCMDQEYGSCRNINVSCPENVNGESQCVITGGSRYSQHTNLKFYCKNGWNDINLTRYIGYLLKNISSNKARNEMFCGMDYSESCIIHSLQPELYCKCPVADYVEQQSEQNQNTTTLIIIISALVLLCVLITFVIIYKSYQHHKVKYSKLNTKENNEKNDDNDTLEEHSENVRISTIYNTRAEQIIETE